MTLPHAWSPVAGGIHLRVQITPRGGRAAVEGIDVDADSVPHLKIRIAAAAVGGDANEAVEKLLAKWLGVPNTTVEVIGGETLRLKMVMVDGDPVRLLHRCQALITPATA